jgi:hypothetical protein
LISKPSLRSIIILPVIPARKVSAGVEQATLYLPTTYTAILYFKKLDCFDTYSISFFRRHSRERELQRRKK